MTQVTPEEIRHLADLARLELSAQETATLGRDLPKIVEFVEGLRQVALDEESTSGQAVSLEALRPDEEGSNTLTLEQLGKLAPVWRDDQLIVPAVFGEENDVA